VGCGGEAMAARAGVAGDRPVGGEEVPGGPRPLEAANPSIALAGWLMRVLSPVVESPMLPVLGAGQHLPLRRSIAEEG
jgi:hypothetical protein